MHRMLNRILIPLFIFFPGVILCQQFSHAAKLYGIQASGFYQLTITPELSSHLDVSLKDLRIVNSKGQYIPYIIKSGLPGLNDQSFQSLPIIENTLRDTGQTHLVLENNTKKNFSEIALIVRNAAVSRTAKISGSDDGKNWFAISEDISLNGGRLSDKDRFVLSISFPPSSYKYFRIVINNQKNDPLNIVEAGQHTSFNQNYRNPLVPNPDPTFVQKDSIDGYSYISITQPAPYHINVITLTVPSPKFFKRRLEVIAGNSYGDFIISSTSPLGYFLPTFNSKHFTIRIHNGDNPSLKITSISTSQEVKQIVAHLEKDEAYTLLMGNKNSSAPDYDLKDFKDSIPANIPALSYQSINKNTSTEVKKEDSHASLWLIIIGVLALLSFFTWNLTKELKQKK